MQDNLARKLPQTDIKPRAVKKKRPAAKPAKQKFRWKLAFMMFIYFAMVMLVIARYAQINELEREISIAKSEFETIESQNISKKVDIQQSINLAEIEKTATQKLGMIKPGQNQIVNIKVTLDDEADVLAPTQENGVFAKAFDGFGKIISYLH